MMRLWVPAKYRRFYFLGNWVFNANIRGKHIAAYGCGGSYKTSNATYRWAARHVWWRFYLIYKWEFVG